jgi:hypothetical protein
MLLANMTVADHIHRAFPHASLLRNHGPPTAATLEGLAARIAAASERSATPLPPFHVHKYAFLCVLSSFQAIFPCSWQLESFARVSGGVLGAVALRCGSGQPPHDQIHAAGSVRRGGQRRIGPNCSPPFCAECTAVHALHVAHSVPCDSLAAAPGVSSRSSCVLSSCVSHSDGTAMLSCTDCSMQLSKPRRAPWTSVRSSASRCSATCARRRPRRPRTSTPSFISWSCCARASRFGFPASPLLFCHTGWCRYYLHSRKPFFPPQLSRV